VTVHRSTFLVAPGGMFLVPKGNTYGIENVCQREVRLFFSQARNIHPANLALRASVQPIALPSRLQQQQLQQQNGDGSLGSIIGGRSYGDISFSEAPVSRPPAPTSRYRVDGSSGAAAASSSRRMNDTSFQEDSRHETEPSDPEDQGDEEVEDESRGQEEDEEEDESAMYMKPPRGKPVAARGRGRGGAATSGKTARGRGSGRGRGRGRGRK
jgi:Mif2/CENP-C like